MKIKMTTYEGDGFPLDLIWRNRDNTSFLVIYKVKITA